VTNHFRTLGLLVIIGLVCGATGRAQDQPAAKVPAVVPLRVQIVLSKYQGDKKISSLPYTLTMNADRGGRASLRLGAQVPIVTAITPDAKAVTGVPPIQQVTYKDVGTNIDCGAWPVDPDGRYRLDITVEDSSVYTQEGQNAMRPGDHPSFRSFRSSNTLLLRDGQTSQFTTATDKVNGEVMKADVTLTVVK
jgi:type II secretory pathway component GspD/PulD (secretin)